VYSTTQSMVQMISETVEGGAPAEADLRDAAAGGGGDAGGGGRDDARVAVRFAQY